MTEVLDARETRLVAVSRENGELLEVNAHLKRYIILMEGDPTRSVGFFKSY